MTNIDKYQEDLEKLITKGQRMQLGFLKEINKIDELPDKEEILKTIKPISFGGNYENWYTESLSIIRQLIPSRLDDFVKLYKNEKRKELDVLTYTISDYLIGISTSRNGSVIADGRAAYPKFENQLRIVLALRNRL